MTQRERIFELLNTTNFPMTRNEMESYFIDHPPKIRLSAICGRTNELLNDGLIRVAKLVFDNITQRHVEALIAVRDRGHQIGLWS